MKLSWGLIAAAAFVLSAEQGFSYFEANFNSHRQAELSRDRGGIRPERPVRPGRPTRPNPPRYEDRFDGLYGPARTIAWIDQGVHRAPKLVEKNVDLGIHGQYVNEVILRALENEISIERAYAQLVTGQIIQLPVSRGMIRKNSEARFYVDGRYSLALQSLHLVITSPDLTGSRGQLQVLLGVAR